MYFGVELLAHVVQMIFKNCLRECNDVSLQSYGKKVREIYYFSTLILPPMNKLSFSLPWPSALLYTPRFTANTQILNRSAAQSWMEFPKITYPI